MKFKSIIVTVIVTVMLALIITCLYTLNMSMCMVIVTILACYGYINFAADFYRWLSREPELTLPAEWEPDEEFEMDYDAIKEEVQHDQL